MSCELCMHLALHSDYYYMFCCQQLRRYRTLTDMVGDAKMWLKAPWQTYNSTKKIKHPDLPKKPLTPFFRYFMEKREKTGKSNPGSSVTDLAKMLSSKFA